MIEANEQNDETAGAQLDEVRLGLAKARLQKVELEIQSLKPQRKWHAAIVPYIPVITAALSVLGFVWGVVLFLNQQERDRRTREDDRISREQTQIRNSYEQLLQFASNSNLTVQNALFLREDIDRLIDALYPPDSRDENMRKRNKEEKTRLREKIFNLIATDCDFTQPRHVRLDIEAIKSWKDYEDGLKGANVPLVNKYIAAFRFLHKRDKKYIESVTYSPETGIIEFAAPTDPLSNSFENLLQGFSLHLKLLNGQERDKALEAFISATHNDTLAVDLFATPSVPVKP